MSLPAITADEAMFAFKAISACNVLSNGTIVTVDDVGDQLVCAMPFPDKVILVLYEKSSGMVTMRTDSEEDEIRVVGPFTRVSDMIAEICEHTHVLHPMLWVPAASYEGEYKALCDKIMGDVVAAFNVTVASGAAADYLITRDRSETVRSAVLLKSDGRNSKMWEARVTTGGRYGEAFYVCMMSAPSTRSLERRGMWTTTINNNTMEDRLFYPKFLARLYDVIAEVILCQTE